MSPELPLREVVILSRISALVALRQEDSLAQELQDAMEQNIPITILREVVLQTYLFAGYAATINAFHILNELVPDNSEFLIEADSSFELWKARGAELCKRIYGEQYEKLIRNMERLHPELSQWMIAEGYGKVLSRPFLSPRVRELLIVAMTTALGVERQFHSHARGALNVGATPDELRQVAEEVFPMVSTDKQVGLRAILDRVLVSS
jgi:4-carboxymuconolactone decarboxylase